MHQVTVSREFNKDAERVWALLDQFSQTWVYHPIVKHSESVNGIERGQGAHRKCEMYNGDVVTEHVTHHDPEAMHYTVEVVDHGPFPTTSMIVDIEVEALDASRSRATYKVNFDMKYGPAGWLMGKLAMKRGLTGMLTSLLEGVDQHLQTGRVVGEKGALGEQLHAA